MDPVGRREQRSNLGIIATDRSPCMLTHHPRSRILTSTARESSKAFVPKSEHHISSSAHFWNQARLHVRCFNRSTVDHVQGL